MKHATYEKQMNTAYKISERSCVENKNGYNKNEFL